MHLTIISYYRKVPLEKLEDVSESTSKSNIITDSNISDTPLRVTRSSSKSSSTSSPKKTDKSKGTGKKTNKPPLKLIKDPFSPQITEEQKEQLKRLKEAKKSVPRKTYSAVRKAKSKQI